MSYQMLGMVAGLGPLVARDLQVKLRNRLAAMGANPQIVLADAAFAEAGQALARDSRATSRKIHVFEASRMLAEQGAQAVVLPCFTSQVFREEVDAEIAPPLFDLMAALKKHVAARVPRGARLGVLTSDFVMASHLFERYFASDYQLLYPSPERQQGLMQAVYGPEGLQQGGLEGAVLDKVKQACRDLYAQGSDALLPGFTELALVAAALQREGIPLPDVHAAYAEYICRSEPLKPAPFKLGVVGGVGPAATVDFMDKLIRNTQASRDQEHIRMVVDHNPQIPDRTANLLYREADPTLALLASCRRLEADGARAIAIPCNTAHAYVEHMQPLLQIPIVNMLVETMRHVRSCHGAHAGVGLLATAGTVASRVYHAAAEQEGIKLLLPAARYQEKVSSAIYGEYGVKAGFTQGRCRQDLLEAVAHLAGQGADVVILGCTELPLVLEPAERFPVGGRQVALVDPTTVLARRCVQLAASHNG